MIRGGNATIYVTDMDRAVDFYTNTLGLVLLGRYGDEWASVDAGNGFMLGLHPVSESAPRPGTSGSISVGLNVTEPLEEVQKRLAQHGVSFMGDIVSDGPGRFARFNDPDGNHLYFWEHSESPAESGVS